MEVFDVIAAEPSEMQIESSFHIYLLARKKLIQ